jgi:hypothetical protein
MPVGVYNTKQQFHIKINLLLNGIREISASDKPVSRLKEFQKLWFRLIWNRNRPVDMYIIIIIIIIVIAIIKD